MDARELIRKAKAGDQEAFSRLYDLYAVPLYRYIYFRLRRKEDAEDLLQVVFLKAWKAMPTYRETSKEVLAYFYTIARNAIIDHLRAKHEYVTEHTEEMLEHVIDEQTSADQSALVRSDLDTIKNLLDRVSDDQREALVLKYINDLTNAEIADIMGKEEATVRQLQSRGLKAARQILDTVYGKR